MIKRLLLTLLISTSLTGLWLSSVEAEGISPSIIVLENMTTDSVVSTEIQISRINTEAEQLFKIDIIGAAEKYVQTPKGKTIRFEKGVSKIWYPLEVHSGDLGSGDYEVAIRVEPLQGIKTDGESTNLSVGNTLNSGVQSSLRFIVTNEAVEQFEIRNLSTADTEVGKTMDFNYDVINQGNVASRPSKIIFTATDVLDAGNTYTETFEGDILPLVKSFSTERINLQTKAKLSPALYNFVIQFYNNADELILENSKLHAQVFPEGTLGQEGRQNNLASDKTYYENGELVVLSTDFENTGELGSSVEWVIEVFKGDTRIDLIKKDPVYIPAKETGKFNHTLTPNQSGPYTIKSYFNYSIFQTEPTEITFRVKGIEVWIGLAILGLGGAALIWKFHGRKGPGKTPKVSSKAPAEKTKRSSKKKA